MRIYCDIVGDLLHFGHINLFKKCKEIGDYLIVGVVSDEVAMSYKRRPIMRMSERIQQIEACKYVDMIIPDCPTPIPEGFLEKYSIDYVVHGDDYGEKDLDYWYSVPKKQGKMKLVSYTKGISTTEIIQRINDIYKTNIPTCD